MLKYSAGIFLGLLAGFLVGVKTEYVTEALHVSRITGRPYLQILAPLNRPWVRIITGEGPH